MRSVAPRSSSSGRALPGVVIAVAVGVMAALSRHEAPVLAPPSGSPGLLELITIAGATVARNAPVGRWVLALNAVAIAAAVAAFVPLGRRVTGTWLGVAPALTLGLTALFAPTLAPPDASVVALAAVTLFAILAEAPVALALSASAATLCVPAAWPVYLLLALALWRVMPRKAIACIAAFAILAQGLRFLVPHLPASVDAASALVWPPDYFARAVARVWSIIAPAGPYAIALATLGAFFARDVVPSRLRTAVAAWVVLPLLLVGFSDVPPLRMLAPLLVFFWALVSAGLAVVVRECRPNFGGLVASALLVALLPGLQIVRANAAHDVDRMPRGHDQLTPASFGRLVAALPDGAVVIREDALTDVMLRSLDGVWQKSGKTLRTIERDSPSLGALARSRATPVFALPSAQLSLQSRGFRLTEAPPPQMAGVVQVEWGGACRQLTGDWQDVRDVAAFRTVAVVAGDDASRGAVDVDVAGNVPFEPRQINWTAYAASGFSQVSYPHAQAEDHTNLEEHLKDEGLPRDGAIMEANHALSLTIWRRPDAPRVLTVDIGGQPSYAMARYAPGVLQRLQLCPAFPYDVGTLEDRH